MDKILAIKNDECLCWKCLQKKNNIHVIEIHEINYPSFFDERSTMIKLCDDCYQESNPEIWSMEVEEDKKNSFLTTYKYENEMMDYIDSLPIQGRQFVLNEYFNDKNSDRMISQDWIDYELGQLSQEKCKSYHMYSLDEINAYQERYKTCRLVMNRTIDSKTKCSGCPFGAYGKFGQTPDEYNISTECYQCKNYIPRKSKDGLLQMNEYQFDLYVKYAEGTISRSELYKLLTGEKFNPFSIFIYKAKKLLKK